MKRKILRKISAFLALSAVVFGLVSCSREIQGKKQAKATKTETNNKTVIRLALKDDSNQNIRAAYPEAGTIAFAKFELFGIASDNGIDDVYWTNSNNTADAKKELTSAEITVTKGATYSFTLKATTIGGAVYSDTTSITIRESGNTLTFALSLVSIGSTGGEGQIPGNAQIGVNLPKDDEGNSLVDKVTVTVYKVGNDGRLASQPVSEELTDVVAEIQDGKANFDSGDLEPGSYCAVFKLWSGENPKHLALAGTWREYFVITGGTTSTSTLNPKDPVNDDEEHPNNNGPAIDTVYSITFHTDGGTSPVFKNFSRNTIINANVLISNRTGYVLDKWYLDEEKTIVFVSTEDFTKDIDLYATWILADEAELDEEDRVAWAVITITAEDDSFGLNYFDNGDCYLFEVETSIEDPTIFWYVDGQKVNGYNELLEIMKDELTFGVHRITAVGIAGENVTYSAEAEIECLAEGEFYISFDLGDTDGAERSTAQ